MVFMIVGYERVSTTGQSTLRQDVMMRQHNIEKVFCEKISGKDRNRPELEKMLAFVRERDTVVIESKEDRYSMTFSIDPKCMGFYPKAPRKGHELTVEQKKANSDRLKQLKRKKQTD